MSTLAAYINEVLARPDVRRARRALRLVDNRLGRKQREHEAASAPFEQRPLERYAIKGSWVAAEVEPFLAPPRSSLNPAGFGSHYFDAEEEL